MISIPTVAFIVVGIIPISLYLLKDKRKLVSCEQKETNKKEEGEEDEFSKVMNDLAARARANEGIKKKFEIENSFVSADEHVRDEFRSAMIKIKNNYDSGHLLGSVIPNLLSMFPKKSTLKEIVQLVMMGSVLQSLLGESLPSLDDMRTAAILIDELWSSEEENGRKRDRLHKIISPSVLSKLIPAWESQWRLVYYALLELFSHGPEERQYALENPDKWVKETLRLYPPVKRIIRKNEEGKELSFSIVDHMKNEEIWGDDCMVFNPRRDYSNNNNNENNNGDDNNNNNNNKEGELRMVFGKGKLQCVAGLKFVLQFCGGIMKKIAENYEREGEGQGEREGEEDKWNEVESPLENRRDVPLYAQLLICKKN